MTAMNQTNPPAARQIALFGFRFDRAAALAVMQAYLVTRLAIFFIIFVTSAFVPMRPGAYLYSDPNNLLLDGLVRDDSWWYVNIATRGYSMGNIATGEQGNAAFFPVYPLLVKVAAALTGSVFTGGILVSNLAFIAALGYLYALVRREYDADTAARAVFFYAAAPTAVFFSALYTESVFMLWVIATFYYARERRWDQAALCGALASGTRNTGVLMAGVIALEGLHQSGVRYLPPAWSRAALWAHARAQLRPALASWRALVAGACAASGLVLYMAYLTNAFGDPLGFIHVQATWGRSTEAGAVAQLIPKTIQNLAIGPRFWAGQFSHQTLVEVLSTLAFAPIILMVARRMRPAYGAYVLLTFITPLMTGTVGSMQRYVLMLFPCFVLLALWARRPWIERLVLGLCLPLTAYFALVFSHWYFAG